MKIIVRAKADEDLDGIFTWIAKDSPRAAVAVIRRIRERIGRLAVSGLENMGRPGLDPGTRELVEPPYVVVYAVHDTRTKSKSSRSFTARRIGKGLTTSQRSRWAMQVWAAERSSSAPSAAIQA